MDDTTYVTTIGADGWGFLLPFIGAINRKGLNYMHAIIVTGLIHSSPNYRQADVNSCPMVEFTLLSFPGNSRESDHRNHHLKPIQFTIRAYGNIAVQVHRECRKGDWISVRGEFQDLPGFDRSPHVRRLVIQRWERLISRPKAGNNSASHDESIGYSEQVEITQNSTQGSER